MFRSCIFGLLTGGIGLVSATQAVAQQKCRPALAFKEVRVERQMIKFVTFTKYFASYMVVFLRFCLI